MNPRPARTAMNARLALPLFALAAAPFLRAADLPDYPAALEQAKTSGKDVLLFEDGSGWSAESPALNAALAAQNVAGGRVILARRDNPNRLTPLTEAERNAERSRPKPDFESKNLPALVLVAPDGHVYAYAEGLTAARLPAALSHLGSRLDLRPRLDALRKKADAATGVERARLLGAYLDSLPFELATRRKDIREILRKEDPKDDTGYTFKYSFDQSGASSLLEGVVLKHIWEKKYDEALAVCNERLRNKVITNNQRQIIMSGRFQVYRAREDIPKAVAELRAILALDPRTDMGRGAAAYLRDHTEPVRLKALAWDQSENPPVWLPMIADVSKIITGPGAYVIEFKHRAGHTRFRRVSLQAGKTELAADDNAKESRKVRLTVSARPSGPVELRAEALGTGWFDGAGDILVTKVD